MGWGIQVSRLSGRARRRVASHRRSCEHQQQLYNFPSILDFKMTILFYIQYDPFDLSNIFPDH